MSTQIFFSYANAPEILLTLQELSEGIAQVGLTAWYDRMQLVAGQTFEDRIVVEIRKSAALVLLVSPATFGSAWVLREIRAAAAAGVPILPVFLRRSAVPPEFASIIASLNRLELFHYARKSWGHALLWHLHRNGIRFDWPPNLPHALPRIEADITAIQPSYSILRAASQQDIADLLARYADAIERNRQWGFGQLNAALIHLHLHDRQRAIDVLREAARHLPRVPDVFYFLALALLAFQPLRRARAPWLPEAEAALVVARRLAPDNPQYAVLDGLITVEHYDANGFRRHGAGDRQQLVRCIQTALQNPEIAEELARLTDTIPIRDPRLQDILRAASP